jgi:hypothetical protein
VWISGRSVIPRPLGALRCSCPRIIGCRVGNSWLQGARLPYAPVSLLTTPACCCVDRGQRFYAAGMTCGDHAGQCCVHRPHIALNCRLCSLIQLLSLRPAPDLPLSAVRDASAPASPMAGHLGRVPLAVARVRESCQLENSGGGRAHRAARVAGPGMPPPGMSNCLRGADAAKTLRAVVLEH